MNTLDDICVVTGDYEILETVVKIKNIKPLHILDINKPPTGNLNNFMDGIKERIDKLDLSSSDGRYEY